MKGSVKGSIRDSGLGFYGLRPRAYHKDLYGARGVEGLNTHNKDSISPI